jgi:hypothetical protein
MQCSRDSGKSSCIDLCDRTADVAGPNRLA